MNLIFFFGHWACNYVNKNKFERRVRKYIFSRYVDGIKVYKLFCLNLICPKLFISGNIRIR